MKLVSLKSNLFKKITDKGFPFLRENGKIIAQFVISAFFIGLGIWFIKHERAELATVTDLIESAKWNWLLAGLFLTVIYIGLQAMMYVASFACLENKISFVDALVLFLKRNFVSVFLPAGGISSLAFFSGSIEKKGIKATQIYFASSIYGFVGILSVVLVAVPAFIYALVEGTIGSGEWYALAAVVILKIGLLLVYRSILKRGVFFKLIVKIFPSAEVFMDDLKNNKINKHNFLLTVFYSVLIEFTGIAHLYIAMLALQVHPALLAAVLGYIISVIFLIVSPFLRGLGPIEVSMSYVLIRYGFGNVESIAITFLYRFFEFWLPLLAGAVTFLMRLNKLLMRVMPALLLLVLGIINIISVLTPAIRERLRLVRDFLPIEAIHATNYLVLMAGLFLLVTAAFMLKGLKSAWWFAMALSIISVIGNLVKAVDYEEAFIALIVVVILFSTRKEYYIKNNPKLRLVGVQTALLSILAVLIYGIIGFYYLDEKHFSIDFSFLQSVKYSIENYFMVISSRLTPNDAFASRFLLSIKVSGFISLGFLIYTLVVPFIPDGEVSDHERKTAKDLLLKNGCTGLDYFKLYSDKLIFCSKSGQSFISYRVSGNFAVVLGNPVFSSRDHMRSGIIEFDKYCLDNGLKSIYYRVPEEDLELYESLGKKNMFLGQEGILNLTNFSLEGGSKKSLRNAYRKIGENGYKSAIHLPPVKDGVLQKIKTVSDEWLQTTERNEIVFSQGMFVWDELKNQTILSVENVEEKVVAFLNIIPDYRKGEATYDLIRKTKDAPNGTLDYIMIELVNYLKSQNYKALNLGFSPMSGLDDPHSFTERSIKFAYEKIRSFSHYRGLRDFKEKFSPEWHNQYLIYTHDYDLLQVPIVLTNVIKP